MVWDRGRNGKRSVGDEIGRKRKTNATGTTRHREFYRYLEKTYVWDLLGETPVRRVKSGEAGRPRGCGKQ